MQLNKYSELIIQLENEELESVNLANDAYNQLFAAYLIEGRLTDAKHLFMRIPAAQKVDNKELAQLQSISLDLQKNAFADFFNHIKYDWSDNIKPLITELTLKTREDVLHLTGNAYTSIYEQNLMHMTQLTGEELKTACDSLGWSSEVVAGEAGAGPQRIVLPKPSVSKAHTGPDNQLFKLTEVVSFLEN